MIKFGNNLVVHSSSIHASDWAGGGVAVMTVKHDDGCHWNADTEHCTCGALVMARAYRFVHGGVIAFDQFGHQMPYYQDWSSAGDRIAQDFPHIEIKAGERIP